ncbi:hypothetical protein HZB07_00740 [Candidatus Saganbacteria bacterium]|nr:hypothetical protein [Candidatus Saganbacteria bacterium]
MPLTGREKATIFLSILGAETASRVLRYLPNELADLIAANINHLPSPSPDALAEVLADLSNFVAIAEKPAVQQIAQPAAVRQPKRQYQILMYERPQVAAFILSQLPPQEYEDALLALPREKPVLLQLVGHIRRNNLREKITQGLREQFKDKLIF